MAERRPGRPFGVAWAETVEELGERYRRERDGQRRMRLQALWLLRQGMALSEVARVVGADYRTVQRWVARYRAGGVEEVLRRLPGHAAHGRPARLSAEQERALSAAGARGELHTAKEAVAWVAEHCGVQYRPKGMYGVFARVGITVKAPRPQAAKASEEAQAAWRGGASNKRSATPA